MTTAKTVTAITLGSALVILSGCAGMDEIKRLEQAVRDADAKAALAMTEAQSGRAEAAKATQIANQATRTANEAIQAADAAKVAAEKMTKNPYAP